MMNRELSCVVSVSGIRGVVGKTIDVDQVLALGAAYGQAVAKGGKVVVGRDSRPTGALFVQAVSAGLRAVGNGKQEYSGRFGFFIQNRVQVVRGALGKFGVGRNQQQSTPGQP